MGKHDDISAVLAADRDAPGGRVRRLVLLLAGAALGLGGIFWAGSLVTARRAPDRPHEPAEEVDTSHYLAPIKTDAAGRGEEEAPFQGFAVAVDTEPPGALVSIGGVARGEAPVLANLACRPGDRIAIRAERPGVRPAVHETTCRADRLVKLTLRVGAR